MTDTETKDRIDLSLKREDARVVMSALDYCLRLNLVEKLSGADAKDHISGKAIAIMGQYAESPFLTVGKRIRDALIELESD